MLSNIISYPLETYGTYMSHEVLLGVLWKPMKNDKKCHFSLVFKGYRI